MEMKRILKKAKKLIALVIIFVFIGFIVFVIQMVEMFNEISDTMEPVYDAKYTFVAPDGVGMAYVGEISGNATVPTSTGIWVCMRGGKCKPQKHLVMFIYKKRISEALMVEWVNNNEIVVSYPYREVIKSFPHSVDGLTVRFSGR